MNRVKYIVGTIVGIGATLIAGVASAAQIVNLPVNFISDCLAYVGNLFTDLSLVIILVIGLPLAFWVIRKTISLVRAR